MLGVRTQTFSVTSAPEDSYISVHVHPDTMPIFATLQEQMEFHETQQCLTSNEKMEESRDIAQQRLPQTTVRGPFDRPISIAEMPETLILIGFGAGVERLASILKSAWYHLKRTTSRTQLRQVHLYWVWTPEQPCEWFTSLVLAIEAQDSENQIETYLVSLCS